MACNELQTRLVVQLAEVQKAMTTANLAELPMLESLKRGIEEQMAVLAQQSVDTNSQAA